MSNRVQSSFSRFAMLLMPLALLGALVVSAPADAASPYTYSLTVKNSTNRYVVIDVGGYNVQESTFDLCPWESRTVKFSSPKSYLVSATDGDVVVSKRLNKSTSIKIQTDQRGRLVIR